MLSVFCMSSILDIDLGVVCVFFFFQAEDGIRDLVRSRGLGDVYKRQQVIFVISDVFRNHAKIHPLIVRVWQEIT
mgnify:CR=1 FL=1